NDGYADFNTSSTRRHFAVKRSPSSKNEGPPSKRPASSALTRSSAGLRGREPHGREISRNVPRRETVSSRRDDYPFPRDDGHSSKDRTLFYVDVSRGYGYCDYDCYSSQDEHESKVFSEHVGYGGGRDRDYSEYGSGSSYRDTYESYGSFHVTPSARGTYSGNSRYDDSSSSRDGYSGSRENHSSSRSDMCERSYERSGRQGMHPPIDREYPERGSRQERGHSPMNRLYAPSCESYSSSSRFGSSSGGRGESSCYSDISRNGVGHNCQQVRHQYDRQYELVRPTQES
ncbi:RNA-binding motif protein, X chromosome-like isoform X1, partial [Sigmodon hispidus]